MSTNPFWPSFGTDVFGAIVTPADVRDAVKDTLQTWEATYVAEINTQKGLDLAEFQDWTVRPEYRSLPATEAPACMVTCPGTTRAPDRKGDGTLITYWAVEVSVVVYGDDWENTEDKTGYYAAVVYAALLQHPSLGGFARSTSLVSYRYAEVEHSSTRTLGAGRLVFEVGVDNTVNTTAGPATVSSPTAVPPTVATVGVTVTKETT